MKAKCNETENRSLPPPGPLSGGVLGLASACHGPGPVGVVSAEHTQGCSLDPLGAAGRAAACSLGGRTSLPRPPARYQLWPGGGRAEMLLQTEAQRGGEKGNPDWDAEPWSFVPRPASLLREGRGPPPVQAERRFSSMGLLGSGSNSSVYFVGFGEIFLKACAPHPGSGAG